MVITPTSQEIFLAFMGVKMARYESKMKVSQPVHNGITSSQKARGRFASDSVLNALNEAQTGRSGESRGVTHRRAAGLVERNLRRERRFERGAVFHGIPQNLGYLRQLARAKNLSDDS